MRRVLLSLILAFAASSIASAQEPAAQMDANAPHPPTNSMDEAVPTLKAPDGAQESQAPTNRVGEAVPPMESSEALDESVTDKNEMAAESQPQDMKTAKFSVTSEDADAWLGRPVYSTDGLHLGEIASLQHDPDGTVQQLKADIGGFLGFGETRILITPDQIKEVKDDSLVLTLTQAEAQELPAIDTDE
jgi:sporulation protein YlmC with PRC-barrel domain